MAEFGTITMKFEDSVVAVPSLVLTRMLTKLFAEPDTATAPPPVQTNAPAPHNAPLPEIGDTFNGGIYAGLTLHDGKPHQLVLLPGDHADLPWKDAVAWAEQQGGTLPTRMDLLVLWQNLKAQFKETYYWSCEQSSDEGSAWCQGFGLGGQDWDLKDDKLRARAVRRIPIE